MDIDYEQLVRDYAKSLPQQSYHSGDLLDIRIAMGRGVFRRNLHKYLKAPYQDIKAALEHL